MTKIQDVLRAYSSGEPLTYQEIVERSGVGRMAVTTYARRLQDSGWLEHKGYIYNEDGRFALFQITEAGLAKLGLRNEYVRPLVDEIEGESVIARAMRTQPNSVFALGARA